MKSLILVLATLGVAGMAFGSADYTICPATGNDTLGCELLITVTAVDLSGNATAFTVTTNPTDQGPFDGSEDTLIGLTNAAGATLDSITISGGSGSGVFGFDNDGACSGHGTSSPAYSPAPTLAECGLTDYTNTDPQDYESAGATFTAIDPSTDFGTVLVDLADGGSTWFDLEEAITASQITPAPEPGSVVLLGAGLAGLAFFARKRRLAR